MASTQAPILPVPGKDNRLITSALPYVNNVPHLGNIIGSVLSADVFARYCKARGYPTLFVCGSDEYGTATETKALEEGVDPATLCAKYHAIHKDIYDWFEINFDKFGRTPTAQQTKITQDIFKKLWANGFIEEQETLQPFCPVEGHSKFLADRFVEGECSICHDLGARGDQCDKCGNLLDPFEPASDTQGEDGEDVQPKATGYLINPRCKLDGATPVRRKTKHLYLRLDALKDEIAAWVAKASLKGGWNKNSIQISESWIQKGLKPRGISRDLRWGTPIPKGLEGLADEEYENKVFYVWFDACIGYVSITATLLDGDDTESNNWEAWWKNPDNVSLYQFMGKDNVSFHSIIFPGSQLGTRDKWTMVHKLSTTEYLNYEGGKFSKSKGVGVFGNSARETGVPPDVWRYYLISRRPETGDSEFMWQEFVDSNNNDLLKNLGNLNQRVVKFCQAKYDSVVPDYTKFSNDYLENHKKDVNAVLKDYLYDLEATRLRSGLSNVMYLSALGNKLLQDNKLDNRLLAEEPDRCAAVIGLALNHINLVAALLAPFMPETAAAIFAMLGAEASTAIPDVWAPDAIRPGQKLGAPKLLFSQIPAGKVDEWREAFGGEEVRRQKELAAEKAAAKTVAKKAAREKAREKKKRSKEEKAAAAAKEASADKTAPAPGAGVEAGEKKDLAGPSIEQVTDALEKTEVHTS